MCYIVMTLRLMILFILFQTFTLISMENEKAIKFLYLYEFKPSYFNIYSKYNLHKVNVLKKITIVKRKLYVLT